MKKYMWVVTPVIGLFLLMFPLWVFGGSPFADEQLNPARQSAADQSSQRFEPVPPPEESSNVAQNTSDKITPNKVPPPPPGKKGITAGSKDFPKWFDDAVAHIKDWDFPTLKNKFGETITPEDFFKAIIWIESNGVHKLGNGVLLRSCVGAIGFTQLMPSTAKSLGVNAQDPAQNLKGGILLLNQIFQLPTVKSATGQEKLLKAVVAYNAGPYSSLLEKSWDKLKMGKAKEPIGYGLKLKMCLGLELTDTEKKLVSKMFGVKIANVDDFANREFYATSHGLR